MARISPGTMTAAIFAILVGLAGAFAVRQYLKEAPAVAQPEPEAPRTYYVPTASTDLVAGRQLTVNDITVVGMTWEQLQNSEYADQPFMQDTRQIAGRVLRGEISKGSSFLTTDFYPEGMGPGIAEHLRPGQRAVTVAIENVGAVEGYARPGTLVDVLFRSAPDPTRPEITITLLEAVDVLAVGQMTVPGHEISGAQSESTQKTTVTLGVTPEQAKALKVVEGRGEMTLALRASDDVGQIISIGHQSRKMTLHQLLGLPDRVTKTMELYKGGEKEVITFDQRVDVSNDPLGGFISTPIAADDQWQSIPSQPVRQTHLPSSNIADRSGS